MQFSKKRPRAAGRSRPVVISAPGHTLGDSASSAGLAPRASCESFCSPCHPGHSMPPPPAHAPLALVSLVGCRGALGTRHVLVVYP